MKIRNFAFRLPRFVPLRVTAAGRSYIGKRTSTLILGFQKIWPFFRITVKDSAAVDATGMFIPIRLISSLYTWNEFEVFSYTAWSLRCSIHCDGPGQMPLKAE